MARGTHQKTFLHYTNSNLTFEEIEFLMQHCGFWWIFIKILQKIEKMCLSLRFWQWKMINAHSDHVIGIVGKPLTQATPRKVILYLWDASIVLELRLKERHYFWKVSKITHFTWISVENHSERVRKRKNHSFLPFGVIETDWSVVLPLRLIC